MKSTEIITGGLLEASTDPRLVGKTQAVANLKANRQRMATPAAAAPGAPTASKPAASDSESAAVDPAATAPATTTTTTTIPGSSKPIEKPGLLYKMGKGILGGAAALGSGRAQQALTRASELEKNRNFRAGPTTTTTTTPGVGETPATAATDSAAAVQQTAAASAAPPVFKDPAAFKAEWDKFVASKPNYKLIADPALLSVLKNMWMRSGGMKAESKKNKRKPV